MEEKLNVTGKLTFGAPDYTQAVENTFAINMLP